MSRIGKYPVEIPQGVQVAIAGGLLYVRNEKTLVCLDLRK